MESNSVCNHTSDNKSEKLFITSMITDRIGRHEILLPINHKNFNFCEKKNSQVMKKRENCIKRLKKGGVNCLMSLCNKDWFECNWLIELSDNNLASELVENRSFLNQSQSRKL